MLNAPTILHQALRWSGRLNWLVERLCALLLASMILIVWYGVMARYVLESGATWTEETARYVMIWGALLAISCGARRREHIGFDALFMKLPAHMQKPLRIVIDLISISFFVYLLVFGIRMTSDGASQYATIFDMTMLIPFAAVPVAAALTVIQLSAALLSYLMNAEELKPISQIEKMEGVA